MTSDRIVLAVIGFLGVASLIGLVGLVWLLDHEADPVSLAVVAGPVSGAMGTLGGILASTRTTSVAVQEAKVEGYQEAVAHVDALGAGAVPVQVVNEGPAEAVPVAENPAPVAAKRGR